jgi:S-adenosylhomocysteine hydrolase
MSNAGDSLLRRLDARFDRGTSATEIPSCLPLLEDLDNALKLTARKHFAGWRCVLVHHLLGSVVPMIDGFYRAGIDRSDFTIIGKAYSSHPAVLGTLAAKGYAVTNAVEGYTTGIPYDDVLTQVIAERLTSLLADPRPLLILDDGGKALSWLLTSWQGPLPSRLAAVELTSRGAHALAGRRLDFPVVNVARSRVKIEVESRLIALSMVAELDNTLRRKASGWSIAGTRIVVRGYGAVGSNVADLLRSHGALVRVIEPDSDRALCALADRFEIAHDYDCDVVVGCTGTSKFTPSDLKMFADGTFLVSMGSSDLEFAPWRYSECLSPTGIACQTPWKYMFEGALNGRSFTLVNGGFPIDFSGSVDPIPAELIQLTRSLLVAGATQAVVHGEPGLFPLSDAVQDQLLQRFGEINGGDWRR